MCKHRVEHHTDDDDADNGATPKSYVVELLEARTHVSDTRAHIRRTVLEEFCKVFSSFLGVLLVAVAAGAAVMLPQRSGRLQGVL